ncbi:MAG: hypothetical protein GX879_07145 [Bacteroidales bacterium]|nr:hypothetical protein [Bacteroidales bacterium]
MKHLTKITFFLILFTFFFNFSCNKDDRIPYVYVNSQVYLNSGIFQDLKIAGNWMYLSGGARGLIVFCVYPEEYLVFDRNCTFEPYNDSARIYVDETNMFAVCKHCESKFNLYDGSVVSGDAKYWLLQYGTRLENDILYIYNTY